jgi:two-component system, NtrC family, sensor histidine kinase KinB
MFTTLRARVFAGFLLILLLLVGLGGYAIYSFGSLADVTSANLEQNAERSLANTVMYESLVRIDRAELRMLAGDTIDAGPELAEQPAQFYYALQKAWSATPAQDPSSPLLTDIENQWQHYQGHLHYFYGLALHKPLLARRLYEDSLSHEVDSLKAHNIALQELNYSAFQTAKLQTRDRARESAAGVIVVTLIALIAGVFGSYLIARRTIKPIKELTDSVKELRAGHLDAHIPISGADEIADLGFEFNRLTERLRQFEAMNINEIVREQQKSEAIIESIDDPLLLFDAGGALLLMNKAAEDITGITEQTALGRPLWQLFRDKRVLKDVERAIEHAAESVRNAAPATSSEDGLAAPPIVSIERRGRTRYFRIRVARIVTSDKMQQENRPLAGILVLFTDITHFQELDQMKSDFIAKVSHEFRTPLTSMTMSLDILGDELIGALNREQHDIIDTSKQDARRLSKLIRDLLTLSRLESTKQRAEAVDEEFEIAETVDQLIRSLTPLYQDRRITLSVDGVTPGWLRMSREHFTSILSNLLSNALKYTPAGGTVTISTTWDENRTEIALRVKDTGVGIAPEDQKRIFDKFVQIKHRDSSTPGSVGLGLAIVREIAARYNGTVELESAVGKGSTFVVRLHVDRFDRLHATREIADHKIS